jgi:hypothetical protein
MNRVATWGRIWTALVVGGVFALAACDNDPAAVEEHIEAAGVLIGYQGADLLRYRDSDPVGPPQLTLSEGVIYTDVEVYFLDEAGDTIAIEHDHAGGGAEEFGLGVTIGNESFVTWDPSPTDDFAGTLTAVAVGTTTITIELLHEGHADYTSPDFTVAVQ